MKRISLLDQDKKLIKFELEYCEDSFERSLSTGAEIITLKILSKDIKIRNGFYIFFYFNGKIKLLEIVNRNCLSKKDLCSFCPIYILYMNVVNI